MRKIMSDSDQPGPLERLEALFCPGSARQSGDISKRGESNLDHWFLDWAYPNKSGGWSSSLKQVMLVAPMAAEGNTGMDVALIQYTHVEEEMEPCRPVQFGGLDEIRVGADIAICG